MRRFELHPRKLRLEELPSCPTSCVSLNTEEGGLHETQAVEVHADAREAELEDLASHSAAIR
eukprot:2822525-Pyramimonas_sp.AAC.1